MIFIFLQQHHLLLKPFLCETPNVSNGLAGRLKCEVNYNPFKYWVTDPYFVWPVKYFTLQKQVVSWQCLDIISRVLWFSKSGKAGAWLLMGMVAPPAAGVASSGVCVAESGAGGQHSRHPAAWHVYSVQYSCTVRVLYTTVQPPGERPTATLTLSSVPAPEQRPTAYCRDKNIIYHQKIFEHHKTQLQWGCDDTVTLVRDKQSHNGWQHLPHRHISGAAPPGIQCKR